MVAVRLFLFNRNPNDMSQLALSQRETEILRLLIADYARKLTDEDEELEPEALSEREQEILILLASGRDHRQIAAHCAIAIRTVRQHVSNILGKMGAQNARHAIALALRLSILTVDQIDPMI